MANLPEIIANMAMGKGVYQGDAKFFAGRWFCG